MFVQLVTGPAKPGGHTKNSSVVAPSVLSVVVVVVVVAAVAEAVSVAVAGVLVARTVSCH